MVFASRRPPTRNTARRPDRPSAWIRPVGNFGPGGTAACAEAIERFHGLRLRFVVIDLADATFVGGDLAGLLAALHRAQPAAQLVLQHPPPTARTAVTAAGLEAFVMTSGHPLPPTSCPRRAASPLPVVLAICLPLNTRRPRRADDALPDPGERGIPMNRRRSGSPVWAPPPR